jgi:hypothetical protein
MMRKNRQLTIKKLAALNLGPSAELVQAPPFRLRQTLGYCGARIQVKGIESYFFATCEILSEKQMCLEEVSAIPAWSSPVDWRLIPQQDRSGAINENPTPREIRDLLFAPVPVVQIAGNFRPTKYVLVGSSTLLKNQPCALRDEQRVCIQFLFTNGVLIEHDFDFHLTHESFSSAPAAGENKRRPLFGHPAPHSTTVSQVEPLQKGQCIEFPLKRPQLE